MTKYVNELYADVFARCYGFRAHRSALLQCFRRQAGPRRRLCRSDPEMDGGDDRRARPVFINGDGETSRDFCYVANAVQANLLAATTQNAEAVNQVYNVAVGDRTTLNELYAELRRLLAPTFRICEEPRRNTAIFAPATCATARRTSARRRGSGLCARRIALTRDWSWRCRGMSGSTVDEAREIKVISKFQAIAQFVVSIAMIATNIEKA